MSAITETFSNIADQVKEKIQNLVSKDSENNNNHNDEDGILSPELERRQLALGHPDTLAPPPMDPPIARRDSLPPSPRPAALHQDHSPTPHSQPPPISPRSKQVEQTQEEGQLRFEPSTVVLSETAPDTLAPPPVDPPIRRRDSLPPSPRQPDEVDSICDPNSDVQLVEKSQHHQQSDVETLRVPDIHSKPVPDHEDTKDIPPVVVVETPPPIENEKDLNDYVPRPASIEDRKGDEKKTEKKTDQGEKEGLAAFPPPLRVKDLNDGQDETFEISGYRGTTSSTKEPKEHSSFNNKIVEMKEEAKASIHQKIEKVKDAIGLGEKEHSINADASYPVATTKQ